jgi:hypothetical protein
MIQPSNASAREAFRSLDLILPALPRLRVLFLTEFLKGWIDAQRVPKRIEP